jgi:hypothetical protein
MKWLSAPYDPVWIVALSHPVQVACFPESLRVSFRAAAKIHHRAVFAEKLTVAQLLKKFLAFYVTKRLTAVFTDAATGPYQGPDVVIYGTQCQTAYR